MTRLLSCIYFRATKWMQSLSFDIVDMCPSIDNQRPMEAVISALEYRINKKPSTECILEGLEICLINIDSLFWFKQLTPKNSDGSNKFLFIWLSILWINVWWVSLRWLFCFAALYWWRKWNISLFILTLWPKVSRAGNTYGDRRREHESASNKSSW